MVSRAKRESNHEAVHALSPLEPSWFETRLKALLTMRGLKTQQKPNPSLYNPRHGGHLNPCRRSRGDDEAP